MSYTGREPDFITQAPLDSSTKVATTAYVDDAVAAADSGAAVADSITDGVTTIAPSQNAVFDALALKAPLASPALTGTPLAPTASLATNTTQIATTAFVAQELAAISVPIVNTYSILDGQSNTLLETLTDPSKTYDITYSVNRSVLDTVKEAFSANMDTLQTYGISSIVNSIAVQSDGKILVGGEFTTYNAQTGKNRLIRLNADGTEDTAFSTNAVVNGTTPRFNNTVFSITVQSDGKILVGGNFSNYNAQTGKNRLIRLNADGTEDTAFSTNAVVNGTTPRFSNAIRSITVQSDGKILVGGEFATYNAQTGKNRLIRLNADGTEDTAFSTNAVVNGTTPRFSGVVRSITVQPDGKILVGGEFTTYNAQTGKSYLIRLNSDGTEDTVFSTNAVVNGATARFNNIIRSITVQSDGKILVGGVFSNYNAQTGKNRLIRLNSNGTEDTAFSTNAVVNGTTARFNDGVFSITVQSDGKILVGGIFTTYNAQTGKNRLIRLNADGTEDTAFSTNAVVNGTILRFNNGVNSIVLNRSRIFVGGDFTDYTTQSSVNSHMLLIEREIRSQIGKLLASPTNTGFSFSTPTTQGPESGYPTGVTMSFNTDGTIKYSSTTLNNSSYAIDTIKMDKKAM
jgi:uncharacterized delta-60 repeat protein